MPIHRKLTVWEKAHALVLAVYRAVAANSFRNIPGLAGQLQRAALAVTSNIAHGAWRESPEAFAASLLVAIEAARELDYLILVAADLGAISRSNHAKLEARTDQVMRMLAGLRASICKRALKARSPARPRRAAVPQ